MADSKDFSNALNMQRRANTCDVPDGYRISSSFYAGAMGISLPDQAANEVKTRKRRTGSGSAKELAASSFQMQQLDLDLGE